MNKENAADAKLQENLAARKPHKKYTFRLAQQVGDIASVERQKLWDKNNGQRVIEHIQVQENIIEEWRESRANNHKNANGGRRWVLSQADYDHYDKQLDRYDTMQEKLEKLDPVKDYSEVNNLRYKLNVIRDDFENVDKYRKLHNASSYECTKAE